MNFASNLDVRNKNHDWRNAPYGISCFLYENENSVAYNLPGPYCMITVFRWNDNRGTAIAIDWRNGSGHSLWVNGLHEQWKSWDAK